MIWPGRLICLTHRSSWPQTCKHTAAYSIHSSWSLTACACATAGGWLEGGAAGNLQLTMPTAFTVAMLSWGLLAFPDGYQKAGATSEALNGSKWGADWLVKAGGEGTNGTSNSSGIVYQLGNWTTDQLVSSPLTLICLCWRMCRLLLCVRWIIYGGSIKM